MLRFLFLCLMLTLRGSADTKLPEDTEGSGPDDEDEVPSNIYREVHINPGKTTGDGEDGLSTIIIIAAVSVVALSITGIVAIVLVRRNMHNRQQGVYSVPADQGMKGVV
ncbi:hypothetical protein UPYG_G00151570 [Umbra pygmaea]|uniref:Uncharacterized protein n=1 Tax=Umbra pygmaea TaxID=75934 RepID=A0ABD0X1J9_UMBPY